MKVQYILDENGNPAEAPDLMTWGRWIQTANRTVAATTIGDVKVSTVFLGLDHSFGEGPPLLWETMIFGGNLDQEQDRCSGSREQAEAMHAAMCARVSSENSLISGESAAILEASPTQPVPKAAKP